jgi:O-antigen ligase
MFRVEYSRKKMTVAVILGMLASAIFVEVMLVTQSRTGWIAVASTLSIALLYGVIKNRRIFRTQATNLTVVLLISLLAVVIYTQHEKIYNRFAEEGRVAQTIITDFDIKNIPYTPLGQRLHLWHFGFNRFLEKPIFGWGPGTSVTKALKNGDFTTTMEKIEAKKLHKHPHLHNTYLITLVRLGIIGTLIVISAFIVLSYGILREYKSAKIDKHISFFYLASLLSFFIANLTMFRLFSQEDTALIYLIFGTIFSYRLASRKQIT